LESLLLRNGAKANARSRDGQTALTLALSNKNTVAASDRPRFEPPYAQISEDELLKQAQRKHAEVIQLLSQRKPKRR
jgi:hypothetical protein